VLAGVQQPLVMALVWFFCLGGLGIWFPYVSLYLHENAGLTGSQVGHVMALLPLVGIAAQPLWGQVADRTGSRTQVLAALALCAAAGYALVGQARGFGAIAASVALLAVFATALVPIAFSVTLAIARSPSAREVGLSRACGTLGFLLAVVAFPWVLDAHQAARGLARTPGGLVSEPGLGIMFPIAGALVAVGGLFALALRRGGAVALHARRGAWRALLRHGPYLRLLAFGLIAFLCLQGPQVFFPVFVRSHGGSIDSVSRMWILMLALEIPLIAFSGASLERVGARGLLAIGVLAGGLRWTVCGLAPDLAWVWPVQILHGVVVAGLVIGGPLYVDQAVPASLSSTGQALYATLGVSLGGITSNLGAGWLLERVSPAAPYLAGGCGALVLGVLLPLLLPPPHRPAGDAAEPPEGAASEGAQESTTRS
jgi:PPP family 3-phenylpropionic acid transporter